MSGTHTATGQDHPEPAAAMASEGHREARELAEAALEWKTLAGQEWDVDGSARDFQPRPHGSYHEDLECHDEDGSGYVLPLPLTDHRIAHMVKAISVRLDLHADHDELSTAVQAVTRAVSEEAARLVAERHPDEAVEVECALWGTPALRYDGTDQEQAALYEKGIPDDSLLNTAVTATPGGIIAVNSIRAQRAAAAAQTEEAGQGPGEGQHPAPGGAGQGLRAHRGRDRPDPGPAGSKLPHQPPPPAYPPASDRPRPAPPRAPPPTAAPGADPAEAPCTSREASPMVTLVTGNIVTKVT